jgi:hypothetical protein
MNTILRHYDTPKRRRKMQELKLENIGTSALSNEAGKWVFFDIRCSVADSESSESFTFRMDRETATRVLTQLQKSLADDKVGL